MQLRRLPRVRMMGLLVLTLFVALCAMLIRYAGILSIPVIYVFAPTIVAGVCSQFEWSRPLVALAFVRGALLFVLAVSCLFPASVLLQVGIGAGVTVLCWQAALTAFFWVPQYFIVVSNYE